MIPAIPQQIPEIINEFIWVQNTFTPETTTGLTVICVRDDTEYQLARKASDNEFETILIDKIPPFESWNYKILPRLNSHVII
jgi:hypothetical protein